jgi:hypothetical protein
MISVTDQIWPLGFGEFSRKQQRTLKPKSNGKTESALYFGWTFCSTALYCCMAMDYPELIDGLGIRGGLVALSLEPPRWWYRYILDARP